MRPEHLIYQSGSNTIRQMPQNYLIAENHPTDKSRWICEPDLAANKDLCTLVFLALFDHCNKYEQDGDKLLERIINPLIKPKITAYVTLH